MRRFLYLITFIFSGQLLFGQTYSSIISDKDIYDFLNWMTRTEKKYDEEPFLKRKRIYYKIATWDTANFVTKDSTLFTKYPFGGFEAQHLFQKKAGTDTMFKQADRKFLFQQYISIKDTIWHQSFNKSKLLKNKNQKRPNRSYYSVPLFSTDKKYVVINKQYYCGNLCAYGGHYIYKKIDENKWALVTIINSWVS